MNKQEIIAAINEYITSNGVQEITGQVMNLILNSIANVIPDDAMLTSSFGGIVKPSDTITVTPGLGRWFIARSGAYPNYGGFTFLDKNLNILSFDGVQWDSSVVELENLSLDVAGGALGYDKFLQISGNPISGGIITYDGDDFNVIGGYGNNGGATISFQPDYTGSRSTNKIFVKASSTVEITSMTNNVNLPIKVPILTILDVDQNTVIDSVVLDVTNTLETRTFVAPQDCYVVGSVANVSFLPQCELKIEVIANVEAPTKLLTSDNYKEFLKDKTLQERIINGDTPSEVQGLTSQRNETNIVQFKGKTLFFWSQGWNVADIRVGDYDVETNTVSNITVAVNPTISGISASIFKCPTTFVYNQKVYLVVTVWNPNYCILYESTNGRDFTEVSRTLADVSGFGMYGNHWIVTEKVNGYFHWYIEGLEGNVWKMKLLRSTQLHTGWELVGNVSGLNPNTGAVGGPCVYLHNGKFKMLYHYAPSNTNLPTIIGYAEADVNDPLYFSALYLPLTGIAHKPFGNLTDQYADPELCEIDGKTYLFCSVVDNTTPLATLYRWECDGRLFDILNSKI